jgi:hypothetical protein
MIYSTLFAICLAIAAARNYADEAKSPTVGRGPLPYTCRATILSYSVLGTARLVVTAQHAFSGKVSCDW